MKSTSDDWLSATALVVSVTKQSPFDPSKDTHREFNPPMKLLPVDEHGEQWESPSSRYSRSFIASSFGFVDLVVHLLGITHLGFPRASWQNGGFIGARNLLGVSFTSA